VAQRAGNGADAEVIAVRPLLGRDNVTLMCGAEVTMLETGPSGRSVTGVVVARNGEREVYTGDIVVISAGAANSAKILLSSANDKHPHGLANGSGQVGRNYMFHNSKAIAAVCTEGNDTVYQKTLGLNDFYSPPRITPIRWATSRWSASPTPRPCGARSPS
jgi:choline dehydrogenase-like flavoprotein